MRYELTDEKKIVSNHTLYRIRALRDFRDVKAGDLGGWIESPRNLSQSGSCWVYDDASVMDDALVHGHASVCGFATITGKANVGDSAHLSGFAKITGKTEIRDCAKVYGNGVVCDEATVCGSAHVSGIAVVSGNALVAGHAKVSGIATLFGYMVVGDQAEVNFPNDVCMITAFLMDHKYYGVYPYTTFYRNAYGDISVATSTQGSSTCQGIREQASLARERLARKGDLKKMLLFDAALEFAKQCCCKTKEEKR